MVGVQGPEDSALAIQHPSPDTNNPQSPPPSCSPESGHSWGLLCPSHPMNHPSMVPRGSGPGSILRSTRIEGQNCSPQAGSVHRNNGGLWLTAGMQPLSCPGPQPQGLRSPGQAGWRGSVRQTLAYQGWAHMTCSLPSLGRQEGRLIGQTPPPQPTSQRILLHRMKWDPREQRQPPTYSSLGYWRPAALRPKLYITVGRGPH